MCEAPEEFRRIARHFRPLTGAGALELLDDAAVFAPPPGRELVITADAMVAGVHFLSSDPPELVARKLLRVNLSDLAAMGADPLSYLLTIAVPRETPDGWFADFAAGLAKDQAEFGLSLLGGDSTSTPGPATLSATLIGHVAPGTAVRRAGAGPGDGIWVTGTIGDGALGLLAAQGRLADPGGFLIRRYRLPEPRVYLKINGIASAAMDISDGLVQDLGHLSRACGLGARIDAALVPLSPAARAAGRLALCLTGGDDYELLMAVPPDREAALLSAAAVADVPVTRIGEFVVCGPGVEVEGVALPPGSGGWSHF